jgi:hypothetical protein
VLHRLSEEAQARFGGRPSLGGWRGAEYPEAVSNTDELPQLLRDAGFTGPSGELAWDPDQAIKVAQWLAETRQAVIGGDALGWRVDGSVCDNIAPADPDRTLVTGWDVRGQITGEQWQDYCRFCLDSALGALSDPITPNEAAEEVVAVRYRLSWRHQIEPGPTTLPGNPAARYWG